MAQDSASVILDFQIHNSFRVRFSSMAIEVEGTNREGRPHFLAEHFDSPNQQHEAVKLGIWIFLVTEILLGSGKLNLTLSAIES